MIRAVLVHRAMVSRGNVIDVDGMAVFTWEKVAENVPCLADLAGKGQPDPTWSPEQRREHDRSGVLFTTVDADIRTGDHVTITRPTGAGTYEVTGQPSKVFGLRGESHREFSLSQVAER